MERHGKAFQSTNLSRSETRKYKHGPQLRLFDLSQPPLNPTDVLVLPPDPPFPHPPGKSDFLTNFFQGAPAPHPVSTFFLATHPALAGLPMSGVHVIHVLHPHASLPPRACFQVRGALLEDHAFHPSRALEAGPDFHSLNP